MKVAIVGGGIIGAAIAYELAARGASVTIYDAGSPGAATHASAGILAPYTEGHSEALLRLGIASMAVYESFVTRVARDASQPIEFRRCGSLHVAFTADEISDLDTLRGRAAGASVAHEMLTGEGARRVEPALAGSVQAALRIEGHGYVGVDRLMAALQAALTRHGVTRIAQRIDSLDAVRCSSDVTVLAAGSWSGQVRANAASPVPVKPIRGQRLQLRSDRASISQVVWSRGCYLVPWIDGHVLVGATSEDVGFDVRATVGGVRTLLEAATAAVPSLANATFESVRVGFRPLASGELPVIGRSSTMRDVCYATGHYRNGVLLAPLTAALVADLLLDGRERPELALVRPDRCGL